MQVLSYQPQSGKYSLFGGDGSQTLNQSVTTVQSSATKVPPDITSPRKTPFQDIPKWSIAHLLAKASRSQFQIEAKTENTMGR